MEPVEGIPQLDANLKVLVDHTPLAGKAIKVGVQ